MDLSQASLTSNLSAYTEISSAAAADTRFMHRGRSVRAALTKSGLRWQFRSGRCCGAVPSASQTGVP